MKNRTRWMRRVGSVLVLAAMVLVAEAAPGAKGAGDTIANYNFRVEIDGVAAGQFTSVDGLSIEQEVIEYQNGDDPLIRKRPGRVKYGDVTLKRGYIATTVLNDWIEGARKGGTDTRNMSIVLLAKDGTTELRRWNCFECFPTKWKMATLDNGGREVLTEELEIALGWFEEA